MTTLNEAERLYLGAVPVDRVYLGADRVWPNPAIFTPPDLSGLTLWYDAAQLSHLAEGAPVNQWPNRVVGGVDLKLLGTPAPIIRKGALKNLPVVRFAYGQGGLEQAALTGITHDHTLAYVGRMWGTTKKRILGGSFPQTNLLVGYWNNNEDVIFMGNWFTGAGFPSGVGAAASTNWKLYSTDGANVYSAAILADLPIAYYKLDDVVGTTAYDSSGNNRHATYVGGPILNLGSFINGMVMRTDGVDDQIQFPASLSIPSGSSITVEWWQYQATAEVQNNSGFQFGGGVGNNIIHAHIPWSDKNIYWDYGDWTTTGRMTANYTAQLDKWTLVHCVYDAATGIRSVSYDGVQAAAGAASFSSVPSAMTGGYFGIGVKAYIDEIAIYTTALTPARRLAHYNARSSVPRFFKNGVLAGTGDQPNQYGWANTFAMSTHPAESSDSEVAEAIMYNRKLSDVDRQKVEAYLRTKWGL